MNVKSELKAQVSRYAEAAKAKGTIANYQIDDSDGLRLKITTVKSEEIVLSITDTLEVFMLTIGLYELSPQTIYDNQGRQQLLDELLNYIDLYINGASEKINLVKGERVHAWKLIVKTNDNEAIFFAQRGLPIMLKRAVGFKEQPLSTK